MVSAHSNSIIFLAKIESQIHVCSDTSFWMSFFQILRRLGANKWILGPPRHAAESQNGGQNYPYLKDGGIFLKDVTDISPTGFRGCLRSAARHHFGWFWTNLWRMLTDLCIIVHRPCFRSLICHPFWMDARFISRRIWFLYNDDVRRSFVLIFLNTFHPE